MHRSLGYRRSLRAAESVSSIPPPHPLAPPPRLCPSVGSIGFLRPSSVAPTALRIIGLVIVAAAPIAFQQSSAPRRVAAKDYAVAPSLSPNSSDTTLVLASPADALDRPDTDQVPEGCGGDLWLRTGDVDAPARDSDDGGSVLEVIGCDADDVTGSH